MCGMPSSPSTPPQVIWKATGESKQDAPTGVAFKASGVYQASGVYHAQGGARTTDAQVGALHPGVVEAEGGAPRAEEAWSVGERGLWGQKAPRTGRPSPTH